MKRLGLLTIAIAIAGLAPFSLNQWQTFVERYHAYHRKLTAEKAEPEAAQARKQAAFEAMLNSALHKTFAEIALEKADEASDWDAKGHIWNALSAAQNGDESAYQHEVEWVKRYLPKTLSADAGFTVGSQDHITDVRIKRWLLQVCGI